MRFNMNFHSFLAHGVGLLLLCQSSALGQDIAVRGRVVDLISDAPVIGASVNINGTVDRITDERGEFRFGSLKPGTYELVVTALGYARQAIRLALATDTLILIRLSPEPLRIDSLRVRGDFIAVRGRVLERVNRRTVMDAIVAGSDGTRDRTGLAGQFKFSRIPAGVPFQIEIAAFGFEPVRVDFSPLKDTALVVLLDVDTMINRLLEARSLQLETRAVRAVGKSYTITRDQLMAQGERPLGEVIHEIMRYAPYSGVATRCVFVDEMLSTGEAVGMMFPEEVHRVEYLFDGRMIRVYTRRFMARMLSSDVELPVPGYSAIPGRGGRGVAWVSCG